MEAKSRVSPRSELLPPFLRIPVFSIYFGKIEALAEQSDVTIPARRNISLFGAVVFL